MIAAQKTFARLLMVAVTALSLLATACGAPPLQTAGFGLDKSSGAVTLGLVIPKAAFEGKPTSGAVRRVQHVSTELTQSVRVTVEPTPGAANIVQTFNLTPVDDAVTGDKIATVTLAGLPAGNNMTVQVDVYDGLGATGYKLETIGGVFDVLEGQTTQAQVGWRTTPTLDAVRALRSLGDRQRLYVRSLSGAYQVGDTVEMYRDAVTGAWVAASPTYLVNDPTPPATQPVVLAGDPKPGENIQLLTDVVIDRLMASKAPDFHPSLIYGQAVGLMVHTYTMGLPGYDDVRLGYRVPKPDAPGVATANLDTYVKTFATANDVKIFDIRGQQATQGINIWIEEPSSPLDATSPYNFPYITPGTWSVSGSQQNGALTRSSSFPRVFTAGQTGQLPAVCLAGSTETFASGVSSLNDPHQVCFDKDNWLYVADTGNHRVVKFSPDGLTMQVVAGQLGDPSDAPDASGVPADLGDRQLDASGNVVVEGVPASATLNAPEGVAVEDWADASGTWYRRIFIGDTGNHRVRVIDTDGKIKTVVGTGIAGDGGAGGIGKTFQVDRPTNIVMSDELRQLFIHDSVNKKILSVDTSVTTITTAPVLHKTSFVGLRTDNTGLAYAKVGGRHYLYYAGFVSSVALCRQEIGNEGPVEVPLGGGLQRLPQPDFVVAPQVELYKVKAIAADSFGNVYVGDCWDDGTLYVEGVQTPTVGRVLIVNTQNPKVFDDVFHLLGVRGKSTYAGDEGKSAPLAGIAFPQGLAIRKVDPGYTSPVYVSTGSDPRVIAIKTW